MGLFDWSSRADLNDAVDPALSTQNGASARSYMPTLRALMASVARFTNDTGGALVTKGNANAYTVQTESGITAPRSGLSLLLRVDRDNTGTPTLAIDGTPPLPWVDIDGQGFASGRLKRGRILRTSFNEDLNGGLGAWQSEVLGAVDNVSDLDKPVSSATTNALAQRLARSANLTDLANKAEARTALELRAGATLDLAGLIDAAAGTGTGIMDPARTAVAIEAQVVAPPTIGADPTGQADALVAFRDAPRITPYQVKPGEYLVSGAVNDPTLLLEYPRPGVRTKGPGDVYGTIDRPFLYRPGRSQLAHQIEKLRSGVAFRIACRGDSLTWGLIGDGLGNPNIEGNGYNGPRSSVTIPQALQAALRSIYQYNPTAGQNISVVNQGYPGDRSYEMLNRWKDYDKANDLDLVVMMIGTNDSTVPYSMVDFIRYYREAIERLREKGTAVIIVAPPPWPTLSGNATLHLYREAAARLAIEYNLPFIDAAEQLRQIGVTPWVAFSGTPDPHLITPAYRALGWGPAAFLTPIGGISERKVGPGAIISAADMPCDGYGGHIKEAAYAVSRAGFVIQVDPTYTLPIAVYVERECVPVMDLVTPDTGQNRNLNMKIDGIDAVTGLFSSPIFDGTFRRAFAGPVLRRGYHLIQFTASGDAAAFLDAVRFVDPATATIGTGGVFRRSPLAGWERPRAFLTGICAERETRFTRWAQWISARIEWGPQQAGIGLVADEIQNLGYLSNNALLILRDGPNLVIRDLIAGTADTVALGVFPADGSVVRSKIDLEFTSPNKGQGQINVYVNGAASATLIRPAPSIVGGYVTVFSLQPGLVHLPALGVLEG